MNPPESAAPGSEAGNPTTPHREGLGASPLRADAAQAAHVRAAPLENPRTFLVRSTREQWRALPLAFLVFPVLDGPVLVFEPTHQPLAELAKEDMAELAALAQRLGRHDRRYRGLLKEIRRLHRRRVALAAGYTWPGNPPGYIAFADE